MEILFFGPEYIMLYGSNLGDVDYVFRGELYELDIETLGVKQVPIPKMEFTEVPLMERNR